MRHLVTPLLRHYVMPLMAVAQVALACAIICNAMFLLQQRMVPLYTPDGVADPAQTLVIWQLSAKGNPWDPARLLAVEAQLRGIPGVQVASLSASVPMETQTLLNGDVYSDNGQRKANTAVYIGDALPAALGLKLVAGRGFSQAEAQFRYHSIGINEPGPTVITQALAEQLFPHGDAIGGDIRIGSAADAAHRTVVGVVAHLMRNQLGNDNRENIDYSMVFPGVPSGWPLPSYVLRLDGSAPLDTVRKAARRIIQSQLGSDMVQGFGVHYDSYAELRDATLATPRAAAWLLFAVNLVVLVVTLAGIMGLAAYRVQQNIHQIGVRRALGARRGHIIRWVLSENALVLGAGLVPGLVLALALNLWLMRHYELSRLPWSYLGGGALALLLIGQLAVLAPSLRASRVAPAEATRGG